MLASHSRRNRSKVGQMSCPQAADRGRFGAQQALLIKPGQAGAGVLSFDDSAAVGSSPATFTCPAAVVVNHPMISRR